MELPAHSVFDAERASAPRKFSSTRMQRPQIKAALIDDLALVVQDRETLSIDAVAHDDEAALTGSVANFV